MVSQSDLSPTGFWISPDPERRATGWLSCCLRLETAECQAVLALGFLDHFKPRRRLEIDSSEAVRPSDESAVPGACLLVDGAATSRYQ